MRDKGGGGKICPRHLKPSVSFSFEVCRSSLFPLLALWGNKNWPPQYEGEKDGIIGECERCEGRTRVPEVNNFPYQRNLLHNVYHYCFYKEELEFLKSNGS